MAPKRKVARQTILQVLTTPRREPGSSNTTGSRKISGNKAWAHTEELEEWAEFTYENLILAFGPILEHDAPAGVYARDFGRVNEAPSTEKEVTAIVSESTMETVKASANCTSALFPELRHDINFSFKQDQNIRNPYYPWWNIRGGLMLDRASGRFGRADWIIYSEAADASSPSPPHHQCDENMEKANTRGKTVVLLVGECKKSENWTWNRCQEKFRQVCSTPGSRSRARSAQIDSLQTIVSEPEPEDDERHALLNPLDQLSTYCFWAKVPFGFLHTEKELILCNPRWIADPDPSNKRPKAGIKYVRVPWQTANTKGKEARDPKLTPEEETRDRILTPELVLHCIIIAASYSKSYSTSDQYIHEDIISWHRVAGPNDGRPEGKGEGKNKNKQYRNKLSGVVRKERYLREYRHLKLID